MVLRRELSYMISSPLRASYIPAFATPIRKENI
jgi:hypothetical protein